WFGFFFNCCNRGFTGGPHRGGGGALYSHLNDSSHASTPHSQGGPQAAQNSANNGANLTPQEQLLAGTGLGLDPENDPVVFTTDYGLEIKSHNVGEVPVSVNDPSGNGTVTVSNTKWNYISAGGYNWIIIGSYSESTYTFFSTIRGDEYSGLDNDGTPAANAISFDEKRPQEIIQGSSVTIPAFTNAIVPANGEIPIGCVLCLCAGRTGISAFDSTGPYVPCFPSSDLDTAMTTVYDKIKSDLGNQIRLTSLTTYGYDDGSYGIYTHNEYLFPLAAKTENSSQNFCVETYLNSNAKRDINVRWWLRTGYSTQGSSAYRIDLDGKVGDDTYKYVNDEESVRPAFVLQLYSA
ncbi:MAG: hypothetical protein J6A98_03955, partial [Clostridia bacterium]|nr:hypothetical protein [Clostridia bacterium]